jgi:hypothetical protein
MQRMESRTTPRTVVDSDGSGVTQEMSPTERYRDWDVVMSETMAHLLSAHASIEEMLPIWPLGNVPLTSIDMASRGVMSALFALDECGIQVWRSLESEKIVRTAAKGEAV